MLVDHDEPGAATTPTAPAPPVGGPRGGAVLLVALVLAVVGAALVAGTIRLGSATGSRPKVVAEVPVTALDMLNAPSNNTPAVVADPADPRVVVIANRIDFPGFSCALQVSGDAGRTWATTAPVPALPPGADTCYAPEVAFDSSGTMQYLFVGLQGPGNKPMGAFLTTSGDKGHTFSTPRQVLGPLNFGVRMAIDAKTGRMHLVWLHATSDPGLGSFVPEPNPIMAAHSDDDGVTFSTPVQVSDPGRARVVGPVLTLGPGSAVHVGYYDLGGDARDYQGLDGPVWEGAWSVVMATSVDGGDRFGPGVVVDDQIVPPERPILIFTMPPPALVADAHRLCSAWTDGRNGDADVLLRCSTDKGATWAPVRRVNDDAVGNGVRQYLPRLSLAPGGRLDVAFLDRRYQPDNDRIDVSYTSSSDGGRTFRPNIRLSREHSSALIGAQYEGPSAEGQHEIGGRLGLLSRRSGALVAWPDSRNSILPGTGQDIFAADVSSGASTQPRLARALGAGLLGTGLLALVALALRRRRRGAARGVAGPGDEVDAHQGAASAGARPKRSRLTWMLLVVLPGLVAVGSVVLLTGSKGPAFPGPQVVEVTMKEFRFDFRPPVHGGRVIFHVRNAGQRDHRAGIYLLPDDMPPIDAQLRGSERRSVDKLADPLPRRPGESESFAVDLVPGQRYALLCFLPTPDGKKTDAQIGMNAEFRPSK